MDACFADAPLYSNDLPNTPTSRRLSEMLSKQVIDVLTGTALPRTFRIAEGALRLPVEPTVEI